MNINNNTAYLSTDTILKGPEFAESMLLNAISYDKAGRPQDKYLQIVDHISGGDIIRGKNKTAVLNFYLGHFYEQAARNTPDKQECIGYLKKARSAYETLLQKSDKKSEELFYAQLQLGFILRALELPWADSEEAFLKAYEIDPERAEPLDQLIKHYLGTQQYAIAYIYSSLAKDTLFDKIHAIRRMWGFNPSLYNWKLLDLHTAVCFQMGAMEEATQTFKQLLVQSEARPDLFEANDLQSIRAKKSLFKDLTPLC